MKNAFDRLFTVNIFKNIDYSKTKELSDIVSLAAAICETPMALITLLDEDTNCFVAKMGVDVSEVPAKTSFCQHTVLQENVMIVADTLADERFVNNPHVINAPKVRFYAGAPLKANNGHNIGTLCVIDTQPRVLDEKQVKALEVLSRQAVILMEYELSQTLLKAQIADIEERNKILLNIAQVQSHDFRGPVASLMGLMNIIKEEDYKAEKEYLQMMEKAITVLDEKIHLIVEYTQVL